MAKRVKVARPLGAKEASDTVLSLDMLRLCFSCSRTGKRLAWRASPSKMVMVMMATMIATRTLSTKIRKTQQHHHHHRPHYHHHHRHPALTLLQLLLIPAGPIQEEKRCWRRITESRTIIAFSVDRATARPCWFPCKIQAHQAHSQSSRVDPLRLLRPCP